MVRTQEQNSHFPTSKPAPPTMVSISPAQFRPQTLESSSFLSLTPHPIQLQPCWSTHSPPPLLGSFLFLEHKYSFTLRPWHLLFPLPETASRGWTADSPHSCQVPAQMPPPRGGLLQASLLASPALSSFEHLPLPDSLYVLTDSFPHSEHKLREGRLSWSPST